MDRQHAQDPGDHPLPPLSDIVENSERAARTLIRDEFDVALTALAVAQTIHDEPEAALREIDEAKRALLTAATFLARLKLCPDQLQELSQGLVNLESRVDHARAEFRKSA